MRKIEITTDPNGLHMIDAETDRGSTIKAQMSDAEEMVKFLAALLGIKAEVATVREPDPDIIAYGAIKDPSAANDAEGWIKWDGKGEPRNFQDDQIVQLRFRNGGQNHYRWRQLKGLAWGHAGHPNDIIAYRAAKIDERL